MAEHSPSRPPAVRELARALRLTREYVGEELLPPIEGWSWYDALRRWAPEYLPTPASKRAVTAPCTRPECGGEVHTDGWGNPILCPASRRCPRCDCPDGHTQCDHCKVCPHAAGSGEPPAPTPLEEAHATVESLRYQIRRAREALGTDEAPAVEVEQIRRDRDELRSLLYEVLGHFIHKGHPGEPCLSSGWISVRTVQRWQEALNKAVDTASKETEA